MNKLTRLKLTSIILFLQICTALHAQEAAAPNWVNKVQKTGREGILRFSKFIMTHDLDGDTVYGEASFKEFLKGYFGGK